MRNEIKESALVRYKDRHGYKVWGKVSYLYTSVVGNECVELTNGERLKVSEVLKVRYP